MGVLGLSSSWRGLPWVGFVLKVWVILGCVYVFSLPLRGQDNGEGDNDDKEFDLDELVLALEEDSTQASSSNKTLALLTVFDHLKFRMSFGTLQTYGRENGNFELSWYSPTFEAGLVFEKKVFKERLGLKGGLTLGSELYRLRPSHGLQYTPEGTLLVPSDSLGISNREWRSSHVSSLYIALPLGIAIYPFKSRDRSVWFGLEGDIRYVMSISQRIRYERLDKRFVSKIYGPYDLQRFQYGVTAVVGIGRFFSVFFRYGISPLFDSTRGPAGNRSVTTSVAGIRLGK